MLSAQVFAVGGDHFLVPIEGVLPLPAQIAGAVVKFVDVDKTVPLGHFSGRGADQINAAPGGIADEVHAVLLHSQLHLFNVLTEVINAAAVVEPAVLGPRILGAQTVLHNHDRNPVAVIDFVQRPAQALGVDLPAPLTGFQVGVLQTLGDIALYRGRVAADAHTIAHVIGERVEVHSALLQLLQVAGLHFDRNAVPASRTPWHNRDTRP